MSEEYIKHLFDVMDGKVNYHNVDNKKRGRKSGYKHSPETREKIAEQMRGRLKDEETKAKISNSLQGVPKPASVRKKISDRKKQPSHSIAADLINQYSGNRKERDVPMTTSEWMDKCGHNKNEVVEWIKNNYEEFNKTEGVCSESELKDCFYKGSVLENDNYRINGEYDE